MARSVNITLPPLPSVEFKLQGNWVKAERLMLNLATSIQSGYDKGVSITSKSILNIVKRSIASGTPPTNGGVTWAPLSEATVKRHGSHNIYFLTGLYYRSISLYRYKNRTLIGLPLNSKKRGTSLTLNRLAIILEYGNSNIPARPLWNPALKSYGGKKKIKSTIIREIRKSIMKDSGLSSSQIRVSSW